MDSTHENKFFVKKSESCFCRAENTLMFVTVWSISLALVQSKHQPWPTRCCPGWTVDSQVSQSVSGHTNNSSFIESGQPDLSAVLSCLYWRFHLVIQKKDWTNKISIISLEKFLIPGFYLLSCLYLLEFVLVLKWVRWDQNLTNIQKTQTSQSPSESL